MTYRAQLIGRAAAWLDVRHPGWFEQIDVGELNMMDSTKCIAAQITGLSNAWSAFGANMQEDTGATDCLSAFAGHENKLYWVREIESRRAAAARERWLPEPALAK